MTELLLATPEPLPMIARTEIHFRPPWSIFAGSIAGPYKGERQSQAQNDDIFRIGGNQHATWLIAADGVGSVPNAHAGAHYAAYYVDRFLSAVDPEQFSSPRILEAAYDNARLQIASHAQEDKAPFQSYATTLLTALVTPSRIYVAKIGDGSILTLEPGASSELTFVSRSDAPYSSSWEGITPLTHPDWHRAFRIEAIDLAKENIHALVLATDGAHPYFWTEGDFNTHVVAKFAIPLLNDHAKGLRAASVILQQMLHSAVLNPVGADDDRTFIIATTQNCGRL